MRKLILIIALTMVPLGIWTAGCRNDDRAAAFPDTPETDALARSAGKVSEIADAELASRSESAPYIPEKPIDRSVLGLPAGDTLARVRAVNDRAGRYAAQVAAEKGSGLFTLPEERNYVASAAPGYGEISGRTAGEAAGAAARNAAAANSEGAVPAPAAKEFWSRPMAARGDAPEGPKRNIPADVSAMAAPAAVLSSGGVFSPAFTPFPQIPASARIVSSEGLAGFEPLPEPIPLAEYNAMVFKELETGMPGRYVSPPPPLSVRAPSSLSASSRAASRGLSVTPPAPQKKTDALLLPLPAALVAAKPVFSKPAASKAAAPATAAAMKPAAAPGIPELTETKAAETAQRRGAVKISGADEFSSVKKALVPLPNLASLQPTPQKSSIQPSMKRKALAIPPPMRKAQALPSPEALAAKADLKDFPALPAIPELTDPAASFIPLPPSLEAPDEPEKVTLRPVRNIRRARELEEIDAATEVPPLKF